MKSRFHGWCRKAALIALAAVLPLVSEACGAGAASSGPSTRGTVTQAPKSVAVGVVAPTSPVQWYTTLAEALGYFKNQNLKVSQPIFKGGEIGVQAVIAGSIPFTQGLMDEVVKAQSVGQDLVMVTLFSQAPLWSWIIATKYHSKITSVAALKGHNVGVTTAGSGSDIWTRVLLEKHGLVPGVDVGIVPVGVGPSMDAAMSSGEIVGGVQVEPFVTQAVLSGQAYVLANANGPSDMVALTGHPQYPSMGLLTTRSFIKAHPALVQRTVNAYVDTLLWINSHSIAQLVDRIPGVTPQTRALWTTVVEHVKAGFSSNGLVTDAEAADVVHFMRSTNQLKGQTSTIDPAKLYDMSFVNKAIALAKAQGLGSAGR